MYPLQKGTFFSSFSHLDVCSSQALLAIWTLKRGDDTAIHRSDMVATQNQHWGFKSEILDNMLLWKYIMISLILNTKPIRSVGTQQPLVPHHGVKDLQAGNIALQRVAMVPPDTHLCCETSAISLILLCALNYYQPQSQMVPSCLYSVGPSPSSPSLLTTSPDPSCPWRWYLQGTRYPTILPRN